MKKIHLISIAILTLFIAGCAQTANPTDQATGTTPSGSEKTQVAQAKDLCTLLSAAEVSKILGYEVETQKGMLPDTETSSGCGYFSDTAGGVTIIYNYDNEYQTAKSQYDSAVSFQEEGKVDGITEEDPSGVGEDAYIWTNSKTTQLNAYNKNTWLTLSIIDDSPDRVANAKKLANAVFGKL